RVSASAADGADAVERTPGDGAVDGNRGGGSRLGFGNGSRLGFRSGSRHGEGDAQHGQGGKSERHDTPQGFGRASLERVAGPGRARRRVAEDGTGAGSATGDGPVAVVAAGAEGNLVGSRDGAGTVLGRARAPERGRRWRGSVVAGLVHVGERVLEDLVRTRDAVG